MWLLIKNWPGRGCSLSEPGPRRVNFMATTESSASAHPSTARKRMHLTLKEAQERYRHELMDDEERSLLRDRIIRLKTQLAFALADYDERVRKPATR
jgi:hypothetical protein